MEFDEQPTNAHAHATWPAPDPSTRVELGPTRGEIVRVEQRSMELVATF